MAKRGQSRGISVASLSPGEHEGIIVRGAAVDRCGQVFHARGGQLPPEYLDRAPHGLPGSVAIPQLIQQGFAGNELIGAAG